MKLEALILRKLYTLCPLCSFIERISICKSNYQAKYHDVAKHHALVLLKLFFEAIYIHYVLMSHHFHTEIIFRVSMSHML